MDAMMQVAPKSSESTRQDSAPVREAIADENDKEEGEDEEGGEGEGDGK